MNKFLENVKIKFNSLGVEDCFIKEDTFIVPIEKDEQIPDYKIAACFTSEDILTIYTSFYHNAILKDEKLKLIVKLNELNNESNLKFTFFGDFIKISIDVLNVEENMVNEVVRNISIMPSMISEFYNDLKPFLK